MRRGRPPYPDTLTPREQEVLALLREGLTNEQIAERLGISFAGAKYHVSEILSKLYVSSRQEAVVWRPLEPVFGLAILGVSLKKFTPEAIMSLTAKAVLATAVSVVALIAIGVGVMALRDDKGSSSGAAPAGNTSPANTSSPAANSAVVAAPAAQQSASRASVPFTSFEAFDKVTSYRAVIRYEQPVLSNSGRPGGPPLEAVVEVEGQNMHAFFKLPDLGDVEFIKSGGSEYTRVRGAWTTDSVPGIDYATLRQADMGTVLNLVRNTSVTDGQMDAVDGTPCQIVTGIPPQQGEGGTRYTFCYAGDMPLSLVQQYFGTTLTLKLSGFNETFNIKAPVQ